MPEISRYHFDRSLFTEPKKFSNVTIYQIGRRLCDKNEEIELHKQLDLYELTVVTAGAGVITTNGVELPVKGGDIHIALPADTHQIVSDGNTPLEYDYLAFNVKNPTYQNELEYILINAYSAAHRKFSDYKITNLLSYALAEFVSNTAFSTEVLSNIFTQILIYTIRDVNDNATQKFPINDQDNAEQLCTRIMHYVDSHIFSMKTLDVLAEVFNYNYSYLSSLFKKTIKLSLNEYFLNKKLETAKFLIAENRYTLTEIAHMLNYSSVYSFSKSFKNKYGIAPSTVKPRK